MKKIKSGLEKHFKIETWVEKNQYGYLIKQKHESEDYPNLFVEETVILTPRVIKKLKVKENDRR